MTASVPEPINVGPIARGNLRASDADRDQVANLLSTAYAEGRLTMEEHEERVGQLMAAKTFDDLIPITRDLVVIGQKVRNLRGHGQSPETDKMIAIFGGVTRTGKWRVRNHTQALALFGGIDLDLRDAIFEAPVVDISGFWCFGGLDIKVTEGIEVRDQTSGIFGGTDVSNIGDPAPGAPTLVIKGVSLFGGVSVRGPKPSKRRK